MSMDLTETASTLFERFQKIEPENAYKILGLLLLEDNCEKQMIRLSFGPDKLIENVVQDGKARLEALTPCSPLVDVAPISDPLLNHAGLSPTIYRPFPSPTTVPVSTPPPYSDPRLRVLADPAMNSNILSSCYGNRVADDYLMRSQHQKFVNFEDQLDFVDARFGGNSADYHYPETFLDNMSPRTGRRRLPCLLEFPPKACHYYIKGFCRNGSNCRYLHVHGHSIIDNLPQMISPNSNEFTVDDHVCVPGSLEKLELEVIELLKCQNGNPVSIASLPLLYYEKYRRSLRAEGYLTESQRHGRAGYNLTKLLARLRNIRLIDRPHGQHSVILAEDAAKYKLENHTERKEPGAVVNGSRQIYLTFPAESTFTEEDVSHYFSTFGQVEDVRIPCQQKRMFGFVTFASASTVKIVLAKGNPHFVCGARVLVKPYREKSKPFDGKYIEKNGHPYYTWESEHDYHSLPRGCEPPRFLRSRMMEEQEAIERERKRLERIELSRKTIASQPAYIGYTGEEQNAMEDPTNYAVLDGLMINMLSNRRSMHTVSNYSDQESQGVNLPESPFASMISDGISA
ncbi:hypothetical protein Dimus_019207 [Dionaea muscipula]